MESSKYTTAKSDYRTRMQTGRCLCGAISYQIDGDLLATVVCHCDHCQRQSGGAFSVNLVVHESQLTVTGELKTYDEASEDGSEIYVRRQFCGACGSPIVSVLTVPAGILAVKAGTLDDKSSVQPWVSLPGMTTSLDRE
jgi:hypothetical protein